MAPNENRKLIILLRHGKVPAMASCSNCQEKFFTPDSLLANSDAAREYLKEKFDQHRCPESRKKGRPVRILNIKRGEM